jgi:hypothetical protein
MMRKLFASVFGVGVIAAALSVPATAGAQQSDGTVYVVHGIPGVPVDVYVNDNNQLPNFQPSTVAGPLTLPAGDYNIKVRPAGDTAATPVIEGNVTLPAGANASLVAHLSAAGDPVLTTFVNDTAPAPAGQGRIVVRHTAAAPAVDVLANGSPAFTNVTNPNEGQTNLPAGTINASVVAAGTTTPVLIGPADVPVEAGVATVVYAVGAPASGNAANTLGVVTQQIQLHGADASVNTGTSGLKDTDAAFPTFAVAVLGVSLLGLTVTFGGLRRARASA